MNCSTKGFLVVFLANLIWLGGCGKIQDILHEDIYVIEGEMDFVNVEGGCWVFVAEDGEPYELVGDKGEEVRMDGAEAKLRVKERDDLLSFCQMGTIVEVLEILWLRKP